MNNSFLSCGLFILIVAFEGMRGYSVFFQRKISEGFGLNEIISMRYQKDLTDTELKIVEERINNFFEEKNIYSLSR